MNTIVTLAFKDLRLLSRNYPALFWIAVFPLLTGLFFGAIFSGMGRPGSGSLPVAVVDEDDSDASRALIGRLEAMPALQVRRLPLAEAQAEVRSGKRVAYIVVPHGFRTATLFSGGQSPSLQIGVDPTRQAEAGYLQGMLMEAVYEGLQQQMANPEQMKKQLKESAESLKQADGLEPKQRESLEQFLGTLGKAMDGIDPNLYRAGQAARPVRIEEVPVALDEKRPPSAFAITFPQAILWGILGCVTSFAISIVSERVEGTFLRLQVAPVSWGQVLAGKGLACFLTCVAVAVVLLALGRLVLGVRVEDPAALALAVGCTALCFVGIMMLLSTLGRTQQAVAGAGWGVLMPLAMIGGGMIPLFVMPGWMKTASTVSPVRWGIMAMEGAIWRGSDWAETLQRCGVLVTVGAVCFALGVMLLSRQRA